MRMTMAIKQEIDWEDFVINKRYSLFPLNTMKIGVLKMWELIFGMLERHRR